MGSESRPVGRDAQPPAVYGNRAWQRRVENRVAGGEPRSARVGQRRLAVQLREEAETLEDGAVAEALGVADEGFVKAAAVGEVGGHAVGDVLAASADCGIVEEVDDGTLDVGQRDAGTVAPHALRPEQLARVDVVQDERRAVMGSVFGADGAGGHDDDGKEQLLGEVPVFGSRPAADVRRREEGGDQHPGVVEDPVAVDGIQLCNRVDPGAHPSQPALARPAPKEFSGGGAVEAKGRHGIVDADEVVGVAHDGGEVPPASGDGVRTGSCVRRQNITKIVINRKCNITFRLAGRKTLERRGRHVCVVRRREVRGKGLGL